MPALDDTEPRNQQLASTLVTPHICVSSAAIRRDDWWGKWWLVETWIFSDDPRQRDRQIIHNKGMSGGGDAPPERLCDTARKVHEYVVDGLRRKFDTGS
jgi:hypothetical protein